MELFFYSFITMDEDQLKNAIKHFDEIKYGMSNYDVKRLDLRPFVKRVQRYINKRQISLYNLKPEWLSYVNERRDENELVEERTQQDELKEKCNPLLADIERMIVNGECHLDNAIERFELIHRYYERLRGDGINESEIVQADLVGILGKYLVPAFGRRFRLKDETHLYLHHLIYKHCGKLIENEEPSDVACHKELPISEGAHETSHKGCYLIQLNCDRGTDKYKIGKARNLLTRFKSSEYRNCFVVMTMNVSDEDECEKEIIKEFDSNFAQVRSDASGNYGREAYRGNIKEMVKLFYSICMKYF